MSSFLGFCEWNTRNRWRDGQVCPDVDKELWRLGPDGSGVFWRWTSVSRCGQGTMAPWARRLGCVLALDKCVRMWTRNYGALGQTARVCFGVLCANKKKEEVKRDFGDLRIRRSEGRVVNTPLVFKRVLFQETRKRKKRGGDPKGEVGEKSSEKRRADRLRKRRGESQSFLLGDADQESETRMSKNALWTGRRKAVE
ncbi:hypothetical protein TNCV_1090401 [Trichonephila clavipes]|uniref:Uncharacterized protein n=1 Tax=Trichonephila clavipes TaxID=2585209 RepID=A0A8X6SS52_TRICX|nr:hypothetical protein TNCV_1090401 [Trichonephila clavipes]